MSPYSPYSALPTKEERLWRYASHSVNPYDWHTNNEVRDKDGRRIPIPIEIYGVKAYDIADELNLPLLYEVEGFHDEDDL